MITGYGINSDYELAECFRLAGSAAERIHINDLINGMRDIEEFHILAFPGGFSFGDHISSGKVFANKFKFHLGKALQTFIRSGNPVIGICNGFQVLTKMGVLPFLTLEQSVTLSRNANNLFEDRWVRLKIKKTNKNIWLSGIEHIDLPVRHGEGRFVCPENILTEIKSTNLDVLHYTDTAGNVTMEYPANPNGSPGAVAGLSDTTGNVLGLMPHPEAFMIRHNHPLWNRNERGIAGDAGSLLKPDDGAGMAIFYNAVNYVKTCL